jgi:hypothetical protein
MTSTLPTGENPDGGTAKGGFRKSKGYFFALRHILNTVKLHGDGLITTFFDLYGFPEDIECFSSAVQISDPIARAAMYEQQIGLDVAVESAECKHFHEWICKLESYAF